MRPSRDDWAMSLVAQTALRSTCCRRQVGCVLLDVRGHVLATGYNGVAAGQPHCNEFEKVQYWEHFRREAEDLVEFPNACPGAASPSGTNLDGCEAIHAEQNALLQCADVHKIHSAYVSASPCVTCTKLLLNTSCERVVYAEDYPHNEARVLWEKAGRFWLQSGYEAR